jgi:hypothetical protein
MALRSSAALRTACIAPLFVAAIFACSAAPALADSPSPDPVPNGPSPDPVPVKPKPKPKPKPVVHHTPAPVVHIQPPAPVVHHVAPPAAPVVVIPPPAPAVVHHHAKRVVHHRKRVVHHKPKPAPAKKPVTHAAPISETVAASQVAAVRTAAIAPLKAVTGDSGSEAAKLLLLAAFALVLVVVASLSLLRLLVVRNTRREW